MSNWFTANRTGPAREGMKRRGAEIVFVESPFGGSWKGRLVGHVFDRQTGREARYIASIVYSEADGYFHVTTQGAEKGGRRHNYFRTLNEAQANLSAWARRRFFVEYPRS